MKKTLQKIYLGLLLLFLYLPIVVLIVFSFNDSKLRGHWAGFTFDWYVELFSDPLILTSFANTLLVAFIATAVSTILGTISAIGIYSLKTRQRDFLLNVNYLPVLNPDIVTGVALMGLFGFMNLEQGFLTLVLSHIVFCVPYIIISIMPKLKQMKKNTIEAAMDLGATPKYTLTHVILPQIKPGIVSGALMAFTLSIDDFIISFFTTGQGISNLSITLYSMTKTGINPSINALSAIIFVIIWILLFLVYKSESDIVKFEV